MPTVWENLDSPAATTKNAPAPARAVNAGRRRLLTRHQTTATSDATRRHSAMRVHCRKRRPEHMDPPRTRRGVVDESTPDARGVTVIQR